MSKRKKLLFYSHYYAPDVEACGQIIKELAEALLAQFEVTVITTVPSYEGKIDDKYKKKRFYSEYINNVELLRVRVPEFHKISKLSRIKNILFYFFAAMKATFRVGKADCVFSYSQPPILGGLLGIWGKWIKRSKYIYQIQDCNPEQILAVGYFKLKPLLWLLKKLDTFSCSKADLVVVPAKDMVDTIEKRFIKHSKRMPRIKVINNWIDEKEIYPLPENHPKVEAFKRKYGLQNKFIISYSGNLGQYYDLINLMQVLRQFGEGTKAKDGRQIVFLFVGNGTKRDEMEFYARENHMGNVVFVPYQAKAELIYSLNAADVHWCVNAKGIKGISCPSKYYGIAAAGKPVLGVLEKGTEIRNVIEESRSGRCCEPSDYEKIKENIKWYIEKAGTEELDNMGKRNRKYLEDNLSEKESIRKYVNEITKIIGGVI